jgi:hypothetical protein
VPSPPRSTRRASSTSAPRTARSTRCGRRRARSSGPTRPAAR